MNTVKKTRKLCGEEQRHHMNQVLAEIKDRHLGKLANIGARGGVAVVVHDLAPDEPDVAGIMGHAGESCFELEPGSRAWRRLRRGDYVTRRWLDRPKEEVTRILLLTGVGSLLINFEPGRGFSLEPGSTAVV